MNQQLCEHILKQVPIYQLMKFCGVNREWKQLINNELNQRKSINDVWFKSHLMLKNKYPRITNRKKGERQYPSCQISQYGMIFKVYSHYNSKTKFKNVDVVIQDGYGNHFLVNHFKSNVSKDFEFYFKNYPNIEQLSIVFPTFKRHVVFSFKSFDIHLFDKTDIFEYEINDTELWRYSDNPIFMLFKMYSLKFNPIHNTFTKDGIIIKKFDVFNEIHRFSINLKNSLYKCQSCFYFKKLPECCIVKFYKFSFREKYFKTSYRYIFVNVKLQHATEILKSNYSLQPAFDEMFNVINMYLSTPHDSKLKHKWILIHQFLID